jgi:hypothetical protein
MQFCIIIWNNIAIKPFLNHSMMNKTDYYKILEINHSATTNDIKIAYRKLALKHHPDRNPHNIKISEEKFKIIAEAYEILVDPKKRNEYDLLNHSDKPTTSSPITKKQKTIYWTGGKLIGLLLIFFIITIINLFEITAFLIIQFFQRYIFPKLLIWSSITIAGTAILATIAYKKNTFVQFYIKIKEILIILSIVIILIWSLNQEYRKHHINHHCTHCGSYKKVSTKSR